MKSILITGCSSGIGYDAARTLTARGWRVFATCRKPEDCDRLESEGLESFPLDVSDADSRVNCLAEALERTGGTLDALYNNAAFACPGAVEDLPVEALREVFETNLFGLHELTRLAIPVMRRQGWDRGWFRIVQGSEIDLYLWNLAENTARRALIENHGFHSMARPTV